MKGRTHSDFCDFRNFPSEIYLNAAKILLRGDVFSLPKSKLFGKENKNCKRVF